MWDLLLSAFALMLVFEGLMPFVSPGRWRALFEQVMRLTDGQLRFIGLASIVAGLALLAIIAAPQCPTDSDWTLHDF